MKRNTSRVLWLSGAGFMLIVALVVSGCGRPARRVHVVDHGKAQVVVIKKGHVHSARCGHYRHNNKWYFVNGHVHGKRCGHAKVNNVWVIRKN